MEVTDATDNGLWEEGMVKERTMDEGRGPRRSSAGGWQSTEKTETQAEFQPFVKFYSSLFLYVTLTTSYTISIRKATNQYKSN